MIQSPYDDGVEAHSCVDDSTDKRFLNILYTVDKDLRFETSCS